WQLCWYDLYQRHSSPDLSHRAWSNRRFYLQPTYPLLCRIGRETWDNCFYQFFVFAIDPWSFDVDILSLFFSIFSAFLTYELAKLSPIKAIRASSLVTIAFFVLFKLIQQSSTYDFNQYLGVIFCASFIGMGLQSRVSRV